MMGKIEGKRRKGQMMRYSDNITNSMNTNLIKPQETMEDRGAECTTVHGVIKSWTDLGIEHTYIRVFDLTIF